MRTTKRYNKSYSRTGTRTGSRTNTRTSTHNTTSRTTGGWSKTTYSCTASGFKQPKQECQWRIGSYRNVYSQFGGTAKKTPFSPTNANKWVKFINNGNRVYKFSNVDFGKYFGQQWKTATPAAAFRWMKQKYGSGIKAVTRGNANCWLVATTPNVTARPFQNYNWK